MHLTHIKIEIDIVLEYDRGDITAHIQDVEQDMSRLGKKLCQVKEK